jgi:hypothetical protein
MNGSAADGLFSFAKTLEFAADDLIATAELKLVGGDELVDDKVKR